MTETPKPPTEVTEKDLPSLDLVFPLAIESYRDLTERMKTQDERIRHTITFVLAITAAVPASFQVFGITPSLLFLYIAGLPFLVCLTLCIIATAKTDFATVSIKSLFDDYLDAPELEAKTLLIKYAGEHQKENILYLAYKHRLFVWALVALAAEITILAVSGLCCL